MTRTSTLRGVAAAHPADLALLQHPQQLGLELERQVADLVQQQRALVGQLEEPRPVGGGAGEGALRVPEELGLQEVLRESPRS